jgi:hypothetical protein
VHNFEKTEEIENIRVFGDCVFSVKAKPHAAGVTLLMMLPFAELWFALVVDMDMLGYGSVPIKTLIYITGKGDTHIDARGQDIMIIKCIFDMQLGRGRAWFWHLLRNPMRTGRTVRSDARQDQVMTA